jgi:hypothetical protein
MKTLLLAIALIFMGAACSLFRDAPVQQSSREPAVLGAKLSMTYQDIRRALKSKGYIISTRVFDDVFGKITLAATDHGALFPSIELKLCATGNIPMSLLLVGDNGSAVMAEAKRSFNLDEFSQVDNFSCSSLTVARKIAEKYYRQRLLLYQNTVVSVFCLQTAGPCAIYMENLAAPCRPADIPERARETP